MKTQLKQGGNKWMKIASISSFLLLASCSEKQLLSDSTLNSENENNLSKNSVELSVSNIVAETEQSSNPASNAIDNSKTTRWSGFGNSVNLTLDLTSQKTIDYMNIAFYRGDERKNTIQVFTSTDNNSWTLVKTKTSSGETEGLELFDLMNSVGRYVRVTCLGNSINNWNSILDIEIYGSNLDIDTPINPSFSGVFDLDDFQIETSWLTGEGSRSTNSYLASGIDNEDWYDKRGDVYDTYVLRSLKTDGNRTEWKEYSGKEASLQVYKSMQYKAIVQDIPENGVTIAQIHNRGGVSRPLLRVYIDDDRRIRIKVTTTDPTASSSSYAVYNGPYYSEGTGFTVKILTQNGNAFVEIETTSGSMSKTITPTDDWDNFSNSYYLKAGVYTEGDDTNPKITFDYFLVDK